MQGALEADGSSGTRPLVASSPSFLGAYNHYPVGDARFPIAASLLPQQGKVSANGTPQEPCAQYFEHTKQQ
jgi:hypothetical protein